MPQLLVIDGDPKTLAGYRSILLDDGYDVKSAVTGSDGLELIEAFGSQFALVLVALCLPDMSGLEVLAAAAEWDVVSLVVGDHITKASRLAARKLGARELVARPLLEGGKLLEIVHRSIARPSTDASKGNNSEPTAYAAGRWAAAVVRIAQMRTDVPTLADWGKRIGKAPATLKSVCATASVRAGDSLAFARVLRVVIRVAGRRCCWFNELEILDPRTMSKLLLRAGISRDATVPGVAEFLCSQRFIAANDLLAAVRIALAPHQGIS